MSKAQAKRTVLIVPGLMGSGEAHWQSHWESSGLGQLADRVAGVARVEQRSWSRPELEPWLDALETAINACPARPVLVCHSLGCVLAAHYAASRPHAVQPAAALLVAPADVERPTAPLEVVCFSPISTARLPYPAIVVASSDDPYCSAVRATYFASQWGARYENVGPLGHINAESRLGGWPGGTGLLLELLNGVE